jgi:hypothetical protein
LARRKALEAVNSAISAHGAVHGASGATSFQEFDKKVVWGLESTIEEATVDAEIMRLR